MAKDLTMFRWEGENRLWNEIMKRLEDRIRNANNYATRSDIADTERSFYCGVLFEAGDVRDYLMELRDEANNPSGSVE
tara:strand:- start:642 stop:875 length:234 start_codon:yes stop_codon:yes gene_type:complete